MTERACCEEISVDFHVVRMSGCPIDGHILTTTANCDRRGGAEVTVALSSYARGSAGATPAELGGKDDFDTVVLENRLCKSGVCHPLDVDGMGPR